MSNNDTKRRRIGVGGATTLPTEDNYGVVCAELKDIKSTMNEMMEHTRLQTQDMTNMMQMMKRMQGEISRLTNECNEMKHIIHETRMSVLIMEYQFLRSTHGLMTWILNNSTTRYY